MAGGWEGSFPLIPSNESNIEILYRLFKQWVELVAPDATWRYGLELAHDGSGAVSTFGHVYLFNWSNFEEGVQKFKEVLAKSV